MSDFKVKMHQIDFGWGFTYKPFKFKVNKN